MVSKLVHFFGDTVYCQSTRNIRIAIVRPGLSGYVAPLISRIPARDALQGAYARHPDVQGRLGCIRLVMVSQPPSAKNGTSQSDVDIPSERDRRYGPLPPKRSDDDDDDAVSMAHTADDSYAESLETLKWFAEK